MDSDIHLAHTPSKRARIFYGDPSAEKMFQKLDEFADKLLQACFEPDSSILKSIGPERLAKLIERYIEHAEFRARLDWAKEQYYEAGNGTGTAPTSNVYVNLAEHKVPQFE